MEQKATYKTDDRRLAEDANYWSTTVHPAKSQAEIMVMLEEFGADNVMVAQGKARGQFAWLIRFQWRGAAYRFTFTPLECKASDKESSFGGKKRPHAEQARYQMGRIAVHFVKAILTAAEAQPAALFGFVELPEAGRHPGGLPVTASELDVSGLIGALPTLTIGDAPMLMPGGPE
jgi:hypothetical protein